MQAQLYRKIRISLLTPRGIMATTFRGRTKAVKARHFVFILVLMILGYLAITFNAFEYIFAYPFCFFQYPFEGDMKNIVEKVMLNEPAGVVPLTPIHYPLILDNPRLCKTEDGDDDSIFILWVIKSRMENFELRDAIRKTWGAEDLISFTPIRRIFVLGVAPGNTQLQQKIAVEHQEHHDIIQGYFVDRYFNNTIKLMLGFQWAVSKCKGARYIGFTDDDFFVAPHNVVEYLKPIPQAEWEHFIMGYIWDFAMPYRLPSNKWYISLSEYPYRFWPPYPTAGCFFVSMLTAERLHIAMQYTKYLRFDDVFVGIAAWKLQLPMKHNKYVYFLRENFPGVQRMHKKVIAVHGYKDPEDLIETWKRYMKMKM